MVERIVDGIFIGLLGVVCLRLLGNQASGRYLEFARSASVLVAAGFFALSVALVLAVLFRERALRLADVVFRRFSPRVAVRVSGMLDAIFTRARRLTDTPAAGP